jgi:hypothetical protein
MFGQSPKTTAETSGAQVQNAQNVVTSTICSKFDHLLLLIAFRVATAGVDRLFPDHSQGFTQRQLAGDAQVEVGLDMVDMGQQQMGSQVAITRFYGGQDAGWSSWPQLDAPERP